MSFPDYKDLEGITKTVSGVIKGSFADTSLVILNKGIKVPMKTLFDSDNNFNHQIFLMQNIISSGWAWIVICITIIHFRKS